MYNEQHSAHCLLTFAESKSQLLLVDGMNMIRNSSRPKDEQRIMTDDDTHDTR